jgi:tripeptide aminopeptidase
MALSRAATSPPALLLLLLVLLARLLAATATPLPPPCPAAASATTLPPTERRQHQQHDDASELDYITSTFVRLASMHSCSGRYVPKPPKRNDEDDDAPSRRAKHYPFVPQDSVAILKAIAKELTQLGAADLRFEAGGTVLTATLLPPTLLQPPFFFSPAAHPPPPPAAAAAKPLALIAHVDQACAFANGKVPIYWLPSARRNASRRVKPRVFSRWNGSPISFPDGTGPHVQLSLSAAASPGDGATAPPFVPRLASAVNRTLITGSGASPLGADGLSGAVVLLALARRWAQARCCHLHAENQCAATRVTTTRAAATSPPPIRLIFLPTGEVRSVQALFPGRRAARRVIGADLAYMLDAERPGDVRYEAPIYARYEMRADASYWLSTALGTGDSPDYPATYGLKACHLPFLAAQVMARVADSLFSPAASDGREPMIEVKSVNLTAAVSKDEHAAVATRSGSVCFVIRAFDDEGLDRARAFLNATIQQVASRPPANKCAVFSLREMRRNDWSYWTLSGRDAGPVRLARAAMRAAGLSPVSTPLRGMTEASLLSDLGVPTVVLYSGWHSAHGPLEWTTAEEMATVTDAAEALAGLWGRHEGAGGFGSCPLGAQFDADEGDRDRGPAP